MKILYIITSLGMGGAETQVCSLADKFELLGHQVTIIYLFGEQVVSPVSENIEVIGLGLKQTPASLVKTLFKLANLVETIRPDVVHSHMVHANLITRGVRLFCKIPVLISTAHSSNEGGKFRMLAYRLTSPLAELTTNVGEQSVKRYIQVGAAKSDKIISMVNGIDVTRFTSKEDSKFKTDLGIVSNTKIFTAVGRNVPEKDYDNLLEAIAAVPKNHDVKFLVVGLNTEQLLNKAKVLRVEHRVVFLGLREDVPNILASTDCLIMSSKLEGLPIVIGEAMASRCNIIATDAGGCREWLTEHEIVVPIQDSNALANAIENKLAQSDDEWERISKLNRQHIIDNFSIDGVAAKWLKYYHDPKSAFDD